MDALNVFGEPILSCSSEPITGFFRDGNCNTTAQDVGMHTVCVQVTAAFLAYSQSQGNDLTTPAPEYDFPGLKPGDRWCLCAARWLQAYQDNMAPKLYLRSTHQRTLETIPLEILRNYSLDLN
jgi:uncharacterized protein (DUF2237 family)